MTWKPTPRRAAWVLVAVNLVLWFIPSDIARQIARDRHTILGLYSLEKFTIQAAILLLSLPAWYILFGQAQRRRLRIFRVAAIVLVLLPGLVAVDLIGRALRPRRYVQDGVSYSRSPNYVNKSTFVDAPRARRTYPSAPGGYPSIVCEFTCDSRGFRNAAALETCDILAVGDSFTEGPEVSDNHPWPVRLGGRTGLKLYNLGVAAGDSHDYLLNLKNVGLPLRPAVALVMIYEGNDFRGTNITVDRDEREDEIAEGGLGLFFKYSPVVLAAKGFIQDHLSAINCDGWVPNASALELMPIRVGPPGQEQAYVFDPKDLLWFDRSPAEMQAFKGFTDTRQAIQEMGALCRQQGTRLAIVYAPCKPHVLMPQAARRPGPLRDFLGLVKSKLPPGPELAARLTERVEACEQATAEVCRQEKIDFVSLTEPLRREMALGRRLYFTYDQHWTPEGHEIVAEVIHDYLRGRDLLPARPASRPVPASAPATQRGRPGE